MEENPEIIPLEKGSSVLLLNIMTRLQAIEISRKAHEKEVSELIVKAHNIGYDKMIMRNLQHLSYRPDKDKSGERAAEYLQSRMYKEEIVSVLPGMTPTSPTKLPGM